MCMQPPCLYSGKGTWARSLSREMLYSKNMFSSSVNQLLSTLLAQGFMACLFHLDAHIAFSCYCPYIYIKKSEECNEFGDLSKLLPGWAWKPDLHFRPLYHPSCSPRCGAALPCCDFWALALQVPSQRPCCHTSVLYTSPWGLPVRSLLQRLSRIGSLVPKCQNSQTLY